MAKAGSWLETNVKIEGFTRLDFDKKKVRKSMGVLGRDVQKAARRLVSRRAVSSAGEYPGRQTGRLQRSIKYKVSRPGFLVRIAPFKTAEMGKDFYPAYLYYGVTGHARREDHKAQPKNGSWQVAPRGNFMTDALESRSANARQVLMKTLQEALIPRAR